MSEKRFKSPIENALRGCQFGVKLGKNRGYPYWILTPNERVLSFQVLDGCAKFHRNRFKITTVGARTDRHIHTERAGDHTGDLIICPMLCYSNGTDNKRTIRPLTFSLVKRDKWMSSHDQLVSRTRYNHILPVWPLSKSTDAITPTRCSVFESTADGSGCAIASNWQGKA